MHLREALDTIPQLVWSALPDGSMDYYNRRWLEYTGLNETQSAGWGWIVAVHPDDAGRLTASWPPVPAQGETGGIAARLRGADGRYRWFLFRAAPLADDNGRIVKWLGTSTDIDDRKLAEQERLFNIVKTVPDVVWEASLGAGSSHPTVDYVSPNIERLLGYSPTGLLEVPDSWRRVVHEEDRERAIRELMEILRAGIGGTLQIRCVAADGRVPWLESKIATIYDDSGRPSGVHGVTTDITDRKRTEDLQRTERCVLEMMASGGPLAKVLDELILMVESRCEGLRCSISLAGDDHEAARAAGLHRWRSMPILSSSGELLGTFDVRHLDTPPWGRFEQQLVEATTRMAGIGIERHRAQERLRRSEAYLYPLKDERSFDAAVQRIHDDDRAKAKSKRFEILWRASLLFGAVLEQSKKVPYADG